MSNCQWLFNPVVVVLFEGQLIQASEPVSLFDLGARFFVL